MDKHQSKCKEKNMNYKWWKHNKVKNHLECLLITKYDSYIYFISNNLSLYQCQLFLLSINFITISIFSSYYIYTQYHIYSIFTCLYISTKIYLSFIGSYVVLMYFGTLSPYYFTYFNALSKLSVT